MLKAESGETGLESALREKPDLILLDIRLPGIPPELTSSKPVPSKSK